MWLLRASLAPARTAPHYAPKRDIHAIHTQHETPHTPNAQFQAKKIPKQQKFSDQAWRAALSFARVALQGVTHAPGACCADSLVQTCGSTHQALADAKAMVAKEARPGFQDHEAFAVAWEAQAQDTLYLPSQKAYGSWKSWGKPQRLESMDHQLEVLRQQMSKGAKRAVKLEKKVRAGRGEQASGWSGLLLYQLERDREGPGTLAYSGPHAHTCRSVLARAAHHPVRRI